MEEQERVSAAREWASAEAHKNMQRQVAHLRDEYEDKIKSMDNDRKKREEQV